MGYIDSNLMTGETIVYADKIHWVAFARPIVLLVIGLILLVAPVVGVAVIGVSLLDFIAVGIQRNASEFAVTNRRVVLKVGLLHRHMVEMPLSKMEALNIDQTLMGRILGYGTIVMGGTGGSKQPFTRVPKPLVFRKHVYEQTEAMGQKVAG